MLCLSLSSYKATDPIMAVPPQLSSEYKNRLIFRIRELLKGTWDHSTMSNPVQISTGTVHMFTENLNVVMLVQNGTEDHMKY